MGHEDQKFIKTIATYTYDIIVRQHPIYIHGYIKSNIEEGFDYYLLHNALNNSLPDPLPNEKQTFYLVQQLAIWLRDSYEDVNKQDNCNPEFVAKKITHIFNSEQYLHLSYETSKNEALPYSHAAIIRSEETPAADCTPPM